MKRAYSCAALVVALTPMLSSVATAGPGRSPGNEAKVEGERGGDDDPPKPGLVWLSGEGGVESANLRTFDAHTDTLSAGFIPTAATGPAFGVGAGLRFSTLTLGARVRGAAFPVDGSPNSVGSWQLWTIDAELGLRIPFGRVEPYVLLGGGYASLGGLDDAARDVGEGLDVNGANVRAGGGLDIRVANHVTVGATGGVDLLLLTRPGVSVADLTEAKRVGTLDEAKARVLEANGASAGTALSLMGVGRLEF